MSVHDTLPRRLTAPQLVGAVAGQEQPRSSWLVLRYLGALAVLAVGVVHLQQYFGPYAQIPTIGTLFLVNFAATSAISLALLAPLEHLTGRRAGAAVALVTIGGITLGAGSFVVLTISERRPLFGFQEPGYDPTAIAISRATEVAAAVLLGASLVARFAGKAPKVRW